MHTAVQSADECTFSHYRTRTVNEQTFQPCTIKLVRSFKDGFCWFCKSRDVSRVLLSILSRHTRRSVRVWSCGDGHCAEQSRTGSKIVMHCRRLMYVSTQYDDVSSRCLVAKPIVRPSVQPSVQPSDVRYLRTSQLTRSYSWRLSIPVVYELACRVATLTYFLVM